VPRQIAELSPRSYDLFLSPDERSVLITNITGREIELVDIKNSRSSRLLVETAEVEANQMAVLRSAAFQPDGKAVYIGDSARGRDLILWRLELSDASFTLRSLPYAMNALTLVMTADDALVVNGMDRFLRVRLDDMTVTGVHDLHRSAWHAVADRSGGTFFVAPADDGARLLHATDGALSEFAALPARATRLALGPSRTPD